MSKRSLAKAALPPKARKALVRLGEDLATARVRRRESQRVWAARLGVSVPTLIRLERGDPGVGIGIVATALWLIGRVGALGDLAEPASDLGALELEVRAATKRRAVRGKASIAARLAREKKARHE